LTSILFSASDGLSETVEDASEYLGAGGEMEGLALEADPRLRDREPRGPLEDLDHGGLLARLEDHPEPDVPARVDDLGELVVTHVVDAFYSDQGTRDA
jgi:hypothetical protein